MKLVNGKKPKHTLRKLLVFMMVFVMLGSTTAYAAGPYASIKVEHIFEDDNNSGGERNDIINSGGVKHEVIQVTPPADEPGDESGVPSDNSNYNVPASPPPKPVVVPSPEPGSTPEPTAEPTPTPDLIAGPIPTPDPTPTSPEGGNVVSPGTLTGDQKKDREDFINEIKNEIQSDSMDAKKAGQIYDKVEELITGKNPDAGEGATPDPVKKTTDDNLWSASNEKLQIKDKEDSSPYRYQVAITDESVAALKAAGYETTRLRITIKVVMATDSDGNPDFTESEENMAKDIMYISVDNGVTWYPVDPNVTREFDPDNDYVRETVFTFVHVLKDPPPPPPTTPAPDPTPDRTPDPTPDRTPDPTPTPVVTPTPGPSEPPTPTTPPDTPDTPDPNTDIPDEDVPLINIAMTGDEIDIFDEEVPLAAVPLTGDESYRWYTLLAFSICGLMALVFTGKRKKQV